MHHCLPSPRWAAPLSLALGLLAGCASPPAASPRAAAPAVAPAALSNAQLPPPAPAVAPAAGRSPTAAPGSAPVPAPAVASAPIPAPAAAPVAAVPPSALPPFALVVKDARQIDGPITAWQKDDKLWLELAPEHFDRPFMLSPKLSSGIGEAFILGGLMAYPVSGAGGAQVVEFVRVHNQVRLQARNVDVYAKPGTPEARAAAVSYSPSLLGSAPVVSQPHPQRRTVLVDASGLFLSDMLGVGMQLQRAFRQGYTLDPRHSAITAVRGSPQSLEIQTQNHYYTPNIGIAQPGTPPGLPVPTVPRYVPDSRSLFVGHHYSLAPLPAEPMTPRRADARIGLMTQTVMDLSDDLERSPRVRMIERWRLQKKDPQAELSEPVKPITFWIDRNVPLKYRPVVAEAILEWNKAFERIGFKNAIVVQQQADDAPFDTLDLGYASVRWLMSAVPSFGAIGPKHVDPRTGEILDADIGFESLSARAQRSVRAQTLSGAAAFAAVLGGGDTPAPGAQAHAHCVYGDLAAEQLSYALDVLEARGDIAPDSPEAEHFVRDYVKDTIMHEVGHALGLRHNFRASRVYSEQQLSDPEFTRVHGTTGSVMEYNAINLPRPGQRGGQPFMTTLGPYDYWAIEYAYKPFAPDQEGAALQRIAARSNEPLLAYGTDEDAAFGIDPETIQLDLGADPIVYAAKRLEIARDLFQRQERRELKPDQSYAVLRRSLAYAIADAGRAVGVLVRQIGGVRTLRDHPGSGRDPLQPADAATQRAALDLIARHVLAIDGLAVTPTLQRRLAPDFDDRGDNPSLSTDYPVPQRLLDLQRAVLNQLMSDAVAARILDSVDKTDRPYTAFQLSELYERLTREVWRELVTGGNISATRRELQRDHVNRLATALLRPSPQARADARSLLRQQALLLQGQLHKALQREPKLDAATRAHLQDSADTLAQALEAKMQRVGV
ncbi:MAG: zinc-dependent metalloprotease [Rubrivivax sp.]|nr:zinc-dependent metalloprotease [Rubrivivax sp.]